MFPQDIYKNLRRFTNAVQLKRASLLFIASKLSESDIELFRQQFQSLDEDGDGVLALTEIAKGMQKIGCTIEYSKLEEFCETLDINKNESIDYSEFLALCLSGLHITDQGYLKTAFEYFDLNGDGFISNDELREVLTGGELGIILPEHEISKIVAEVDRNNDRCIDYVEFLDMMIHRR